jgi:NNP family nitrate/nitrite transporter-like MFS transporter
MTTKTVSDLPVTTIAQRPGRWIDGWDPEDSAQWAAGGKKIANRNLIFSIFAEFLGFAVWALWSIVVPQLNNVGFKLDTNQMFWLVSIPALVGATIRIPYTIAVPIFGGRNWTIVSALLLTIPAGALAWAVNHPELPFGALVAIAALAGFGGGNFASSMANIAYFFPQAEKGKALGLNAAGGNIGTAAVQFAVPIVIIAGSGIALDRAGLMFIPLCLLAAGFAFFGMNNLSSAKANPKVYAEAAKEPHTWILSIIYIGTFGSFIGYSGAFPTLLKGQFPEVTLSLAFLGALVGSISRPLGGILADKVGGARVTIVSMLAIALGAAGAIAGLQTRSFGLFFGSFLWLFVFTGVGNGSVYRMIPAVFTSLSDGSEQGKSRALAVTAGCIGIAGAVGAIGGFLIPRGFALSTQLSGGIIPALYGFIGVYLVLTVLTWAVYARKSAALAAAAV